MGEHDRRGAALGCALASLLVARYVFSEYVRGGPLIRNKELSARLLRLRTATVLAAAEDPYIFR